MAKHIVIGNSKDYKEVRFDGNWRKCIGTGRLGLALQKEYLDHLAVIQRQINFDYIRGHGLFTDDVGIYREVEIDGIKKPFFNFTYIDRIFDSFLELGLRPFVEFGFMPGDLASGEQTIFYWKGNVTPPSDYDKWRDLIKSTVTHFIDRYGLTEVTKWPFEVWNEPNLTNFWKDADQAEYFRLYKVTASAVKEVHDGLQVGGPAISGGSDEWISSFLNFCNEEGVPVDFVSRHAYSSRPPKKKTSEYYYQDLVDPENMLEQFATVRNIIKGSPFPNLPFHITEYNTSYNPTNPIHDTVFNAAYLARILSEAGEYVDSFSYWTFSDVFEESDVPKAQFHGGFGLIALNNVAKPTFHLFSFFNRIGEVVLYRDETVLITRKENGSIALIAWNLVWDKDENSEYTFDLDLHLPFNDAFLQRETIDEVCGNTWQSWRQMGRPRFPSSEQISILQKVAHPYMRTWRQSSSDGLVHLELTLTKNEVTLVMINQIHDETYTYVGLDDSLLISYNSE